MTERKERPYRRNDVRREAEAFILARAAEGEFPTHSEITQHVYARLMVSMPQMVLTWQRWLSLEIGAFLRETDESRLRRWLPLSDPQGRGVPVWAPHAPLRLFDLIDSDLAVTGPAYRAHGRAERRREIEREVLASEQSRQGRELTADECRPAVEAALVAEGLL